MTSAMLVDISPKAQYQACEMQKIRHLGVIRLGIRLADESFVIFMLAMLVLVLQRLPVISELLSLPGGGLVAG